MDTPRQDTTTMLDVLVVEKGLVAHRQIADTLEDMQEVVGGYIELAGTIAGDPDQPGGIVLYVNEEGKLRALRPSMIAPWLDDYLVGPVLVVAQDDDGSNRSMTATEIFVTSMVLDGLLTDDGGHILHPPPRPRRRGGHRHHAEHHHHHDDA